MKKSIQKVFIVLFVVCISLMTVGCSNKKVTIGIIQLMTHTSLNTIQDAIYGELENKGYIDGENCTIVYKNANGDTSALPEIVSTMEAKGCDVIIAITTPVALACQDIAKDIPVVFAAVSDPVGTGLIEDIDNPTNMTGTSDQIQVNEILNFAKETSSLNGKEFKRLGYLYNPSEANSVSALEKIEAYTEENGITLVAKSITSTSEISNVVESIVGNIDALYITDDNTVASGMGILSNVALSNDLPLYTSVDSEVQDGGLLSIGITYDILGEKTADMAIEIIEGTPVSDVPIELFGDYLKLFVNTDTKDALGFSIPENSYTLVEFPEN